MGGAAIPHDRKLAIIADALPRLAAGESTDTIGLTHGVTGRAIRAWLLTEASEEAEQARAAYLTDQLLHWQEQIEMADDAIPLARAREGFRAAAWIAERRLASFRPQQQSGATGVTINIARDGVTISQDRPAIEHKP